MFWYFAVARRTAAMAEPSPTGGAPGLAAAAPAAGDGPTGPRATDVSHAMNPDAEDRGERCRSDEPSETLSRAFMSHLPWRPALTGPLRPPYQEMRQKDQEIRHVRMSPFLMPQTGITERLLAWRPR
jgi:hypothetical protein